MHKFSSRKQSVVANDHDTFELNNRSEEKKCLNDTTILLNWNDNLIWKYDHAQDPSKCLSISSS